MDTKKASAQYMQMKDNIVEEMKLSSAMNNRVIYMSEDVTDDACFKLNYHLDRIKRLDLKKGTKEKITINISSFGGSIYDGLSSISRLEELKENGYIIETIVDGYAMSMGSALSQCGSKGYRKARRYATFLYHQPSSGVRGSLIEMEIDVTETNRLWGVMKDITLKNTNFQVEELNKIYENNKNVYYTPEEMLERGVIDEIL